jgi:hypothetical protein
MLWPAAVRTELASLLRTSEQDLSMPRVQFLRLLRRSTRSRLSIPLHHSLIFLVLRISPESPLLSRKGIGK